MHPIVKGKNIANSIKQIIQDLEGIDKELAEISKKGLETAQRTLIIESQNPNFTQKHGQLLANEIGLIENDINQYEIYAPVSGDPDIAYEMYYAEYGAGVGSSNALDKSSRMGSGYIPHTRADGYWVYPLIDGTWSSLVNTSEPANYMYQARQTIRQEMKKLKIKLQTKIRTRIKRNR